MSNRPALRPYQERAIADLRQAYATGARAPLLVAPTGSGKTLMFAAIAAGAVSGTIRAWRITRTAAWCYGIANPGGADLIGWRSVLVTPDMIGQRLAVFAAIEVKTDAGRLTLDQRRFRAAVQQAGGFAGAARTAEEAAAALRLEIGAG